MGILPQLFLTLLYLAVAGYAVRHEHYTLLMLVVVGFFLPASAQSQTLESLTATAKGHGRIISATDEREVTAALVVLRENGTALIAIYADVQLQAEGTWSTSASSPEEILLKITGGSLKEK